MNDDQGSVRALLDRAADVTVPAPPSVTVFRDRRRRARHRHAAQALVAAVATAAVVVGSVVGAVDLTGGSGPNGHHDRRPLPPTAGRSISAQDLASGHWRTIPTAPVDKCGTQTVVSIGGSVVLLVTGDRPTCLNAAAAYRTSTGTWRTLPPPPAALRGAVLTLWTGTRLDVIARSTRAFASFDPASDRWTVLPSVPLPLNAKPFPTTAPVLVVGSTSLLLLGAGSQSDRVLAFDGSHWSPLPALPHQGGSIDNIAAYSGGDVTWALLTETFPIHDGGETTLKVLRRSGGAWETVARPHQLEPLTVYSVQPLGAGQVAVGSVCTPYGSCPEGEPTLVQLVSLTDTLTVGASTTPSRGDLLTGFSNGHLVFADLTDGPMSRVADGSTAIYDPTRRTWLSGPIRPNDVSGETLVGEAWTTRGFVELATLHRGGHGAIGGAVLVPAGDVGR